MINNDVHNSVPIFSQYCRKTLQVKETASNVTESIISGYY